MKNHLVFGLSSLIIILSGCTKYPYKKKTAFTNKAFNSYQEGKVFYLPILVGKNIYIVDSDYLSLTNRKTKEGTKIKNIDLYVNYSFDKIEKHLMKVDLNLIKERKFDPIINIYLDYSGNNIYFFKNQYPPELNNTVIYLLFLENVLTFIDDETGYEFIEYTPN